VREEGADRAQLRYWDAPLIESGAALVSERLRLLEELAEPLHLTHAEIAPDEAATARLSVAYRSNVPYEADRGIRDALARRLEETADKEVWNGATLVGPHRDDLGFTLGDRDLADFGSRGQQRTAILAFKLAELDLLTAHDRRPPLLLLDDVFSELDPDRRGHLVRRIASLPQAFVTTTTPDDLDPSLVDASAGWQVRADRSGGASLESGDSDQEAAG
jgi:DNA replication and repair protein RecF